MFLLWLCLLVGLIRGNLQLHCDLWLVSHQRWVPKEFSTDPSSERLFGSVPFRVSLTTESRCLPGSGELCVQPGPVLLRPQCLALSAPVFSESCSLRLPQGPDWDIIIYCKFAMRHYSIDDVLVRVLPALEPAEEARGCCKPTTLTAQPITACRPPGHLGMARKPLPLLSLVMVTVLLLHPENVPRRLLGSLEQTTKGREAPAQTTGWG